MSHIDTVKEEALDAVLELLDGFKGGKGLTTQEWAEVLLAVSRQLKNFAEIVEGGRCYEPLR